VPNKKGIPMNRCDVLKKIAAELASGEVSFPTNAMLALKLQRALENPDCHVDEAARLIRAEPLLSAKVVALANSTAFNASGRAITDVKNAISRLGFRTLRTLATSVVSKQLASAGSERERAFSTKLWEHTTQVAALSYFIAKKVTRLDPETAMFAGMVHEVGGFYMISRAADFPGLLDEDFSAWSENGEADIGRAVLKVLGVPGSIIEAIEVCWQGFIAMPPQSLGDTLLLADYLSPVESPLRDLNGVPREGMAASIDMMVGKETLAEILAESADDVNSLIAALR
jgi:HD-like signal output (HDOD) protein